MLSVARKILHRSFPYNGSYARIHASSRLAASNYALFEIGTPNSLDYRAYIIGQNGLISPFHDIPLYANRERQEFNMVVEIPRWTNAKVEICKSERLNPLKHDVKDGKIRFVHNLYPYHGYLWNYGALPQTWEDPEHVDAHTNARGDNDPLDVCEIGSRVQRRGAVIRVKILGVLGLIDEGETDWKLLAIDVNDPLAAKLSNIGDIDRVCPGLLADTHRWFKLYKVPTGKKPNKFAFDGQFRDANFAHGLIKQTNEYWSKLMSKDCGEARVFNKISLASRLITNSNKITDVEARTAARLATSDGQLKSPATVPDEIHNWFHTSKDLAKE